MRLVNDSLLALRSATCPNLTPQGGGLINSFIARQRTDAVMQRNIKADAGALPGPWRLRLQAECAVKGSGVPKAEGDFCGTAPVETQAPSWRQIQGKALP